MRHGSWASQRKRAGPPTHAASPPPAAEVEPGSGVLPCAGSGPGQRGTGPSSTTFQCGCAMKHWNANGPWKSWPVSAADEGLPAKAQLRRRAGDDDRPTREVPDAALGGVMPWCSRGGDAWCSWCAPCLVVPDVSDTSRKERVSTWGEVLINPASQMMRATARSQRCASPANCTWTEPTRDDRALGDRRSRSRRRASETGL